MPGPSSYPCGTLLCMDITIRAARPEEYPALGELTARAYLDDGLLDSGESDSYLLVLRDVAGRAEETEVLVAADSASDEVLGGVAFVTPGSRYADVAREDEGEFRMLAMAPAARRRGAAEALVRACLDRAREARELLQVLPEDSPVRAALDAFAEVVATRTA